MSLLCAIIGHHYPEKPEDVLNQKCLRCDHRLDNWRGVRD
jgi:hypothetical protein